MRGRFDELPVDEVYAGVERRSFSSKQATVTTYAFAPSATFPTHRHPGEQITLVQDGEAIVTIGKRSETLRAGDWTIVEPDVEHGLRAGPEGARILAIVVPRRASGDAYTVVEDSVGR